MCGTSMPRTCQCDRSRLRERCRRRCGRLSRGRHRRSRPRHRSTRSRRRAPSRSLWQDAATRSCECSTLVRRASRRVRVFWAIRTMCEPCRQSMPSRTNVALCACSNTRADQNTIHTTKQSGVRQCRWHDTSVGPSTAAELAHVQRLPRRQCVGDRGSSYSREPEAADCWWSRLLDRGVQLREQGAVPARARQGPGGGSGILVVLGTAVELQSSTERQLLGTRARSHPRACYNGAHEPGVVIGTGSARPYDTCACIESCGVGASERDCRTRSHRSTQHSQQSTTGADRGHVGSAGAVGRAPRQASARLWRERQLGRDAQVVVRDRGGAELVHGRHQDWSTPNRTKMIRY